MQNRHLGKRRTLPWEKFKNYPFYEWDDWHYQEFMMRILRTLEARFFRSKKLICKELEESLEMYFIQRGKFNVGYEINKI